MIHLWNSKYFMDNSFFAYLQQLEILVFFSGYPLLYLLLQSFASIPSVKENLKKRVLFVLPYGYAFAGLLFLGFELKNASTDFTVENIFLRIQTPFLFYWGLLSLIFWVPFFSRNTLFSFLHSLVFVFFVLKNLFWQGSSNLTDHSVAKNNMKVYMISLLLHFVILIGACLFSFLVKAKPFTQKK